jgi:hypothetical protein
LPRPPETDLRRVDFPIPDGPIISRIFPAEGVRE